MVTVKVGLSEEIFVIHKELVCYHSTFFKGALSGNFAEAQEGVVRLREENVTVFKHFETWIYRQQLPSIDGNDAQSAQPWDALVDLYIFADAHGVPALRNQIIENLIDLATKEQRTPALTTIASAWYRLPPTSPLRKLFINIYAWQVDGKTVIARELNKLPKEFLSGALLVCMKRLSSRSKGKAAPFETNRCQFHTHGSQDEAKECEKRQTLKKPSRKPTKK